MCPITGSGVTSSAWNTKSSMLAMIKEDELCVVPYPPAILADPAILDQLIIRQSVRYVPRTD